MNPETPLLPDDPILLQQMIRELLEKLSASEKKQEQLEYKLQELLRKLFGRRSEKLDPNQLDLDLGSLGLSRPEIDAGPEVPAAEKPRRKLRRGGRRKLPSELPRRRVEYHLPQEERGCTCCQEPMSVIREEVTEQLEFEPASFFVIEHVRLVYACAKKCDESPAISSKPPQPLEKGIPGPGLLAHVASSKYCDHLPLHRLEGIFRRQGVDIARSTMCDWVAVISRLVAPLVAYMKAQVLLSKIIGTDDTPVTVMDAGGSRKGRLWAYLGDEEHPFDVFDYTRTRERDGPARFLEGFEGYLQADAYSGYDQLYAEGSVIEVGCWMHARRYFYEASRADPARPCVALAMIRELFSIERRCKNQDVQQRYVERQKHAVPILDTFETWLQEQSLLAPPKSPLGRAVGYAQRQWSALRRYTEDGALEIDNGRTERALRGIAIGRKNWLFAGSDTGGERAANIYSLIGTCKRHRVDPEAYLRDLLKLLPTHPVDWMNSRPWRGRSARPLSGLPETRFTASLSLLHRSSAEFEGGPVVHRTLTATRRTDFAVLVSPFLQL